MTRTMAAEHRRSEISTRLQPPGNMLNGDLRDEPRRFIPPRESPDDWPDTRRR